MVMRLLPKARQKMATLPTERAELQRDIRAYIHRVGPELGSVYLDKEVKWDEIIRKVRACVVVVVVVVGVWLGGEWWVWETCREREGEGRRGGALLRWPGQVDGLNGVGLSQSA